MIRKAVCLSSDPRDFTDGKIEKITLVLASEVWQWATHLGRMAETSCPQISSAARERAENSFAHVVHIFCRFENERCRRRDIESIFYTLQPTMMNMISLN